MLFSAYLDGAVSGVEMQSVSGHLADCRGCREEFSRWRAVQEVLTAAAPVRMPADLGLRLRVAISHEHSRRMTRWWNSLPLVWENTMRPALLQFSAGLASTVLLLGGLAMLIGVVAAPQAVMANDEPLGALTAPHYAYSIVPLQPIHTPAEGGNQAPGGVADEEVHDSTIVVQATVDPEGHVCDFSLLSGPRDADTLTQVRNQLMLQVYEPARAFGEAITGHALITFAAVSVRG